MPPYQPTLAADPSFVVYRVKAMKQEEFDNIAKALRPLMYDVGMRYFHSQDDAEDVAQESLLLLWRYCEKIDASRDVRQLAIKVAKNCCVSMMRQRKFITTPLSDYTENVAQQSDTEEERLPLHVLAPRERELFELRQLDGLSNDEIEQLTGIKKTTVQSMVSLARKKLFDEIKRRMRQ